MSRECQTRVDRASAHLHGLLDLPAARVDPLRTAFQRRAKTTTLPRAKAERKIEPREQREPDRAAHQSLLHRSNGPGQRTLPQLVPHRPHTQHQHRARWFLHSHVAWRLAMVRDEQVRADRNEGQPQCRLREVREAKR